jgi:hypothetical protein
MADTFGGQGLGERDPMTLYADDPAADLVAHAGAGVPLALMAGDSLTIPYRSPRDGRELLLMLAVTERPADTIEELDT